MAKALIAAITQMYFLMEILRVFCVTSRQLSKMFIQPLPDLKESFMKRIVTALLMASVVVAVPLACPLFGEANEKVVLACYALRQRK